MTKKLLPHLYFLPIYFALGVADFKDIDAIACIKIGAGLVIGKGNLFVVDDTAK